jgi:hypothetical protein
MMKIGPKVEAIEGYIIDELMELREKETLLANQIRQRMNYIIGVISSSFKVKVDHWEYYLYKENVEQLSFSTYEFITCHDEKYIYYEIYGENYSCVDNLIMLDKFGVEVSLGTMIPIRWLGENFEKELTDGRDAYREIKKKEDSIKKAAIKATLKKRAATLASIRSKLTSEEFNSIDIKI